MWSQKYSCSVLLLFVLIFFSGVTWSYSQSLSLSECNHVCGQPWNNGAYQSTHPHPCCTFLSNSHVGRSFTNNLSKYIQHFIQLLSAIKTPLYPSYLIDIKNSIIDAVVASKIDLSSFMMQFENVRYYDSNSQLIAILSALKGLLPLNSFKSNIEILLSYINHDDYSSHNRFINQDGYLNNHWYGTSYDVANPFDAYINTHSPYSQLSCSLIGNIIDYYQKLCRSSACGKCGGSSLLDSFQMSYDKRRSIDNSNLLYQNINYERNVRRRNEIIHTFLSILPVPHNNLEKQKYNIIKLFLQSSQFDKYIKEFNRIDESTVQELILTIIKKIINDTFSITIKDAFTYYLNLCIPTTITAPQPLDYIILTDILPPPLDDAEQEKYSLVKNFFTSNNIQTYLHNFNATTYKDDSELLKNVLQHLSESKVDQKLKESFKYYLHHEESVQSLELNAKKEIKKHFKLTKIFVNTLDSSSLSSESRVALKKFYKYISGITAEQLKNFNSWSEVKTQGEFMKALLEYFLQQTFVPDDVKVCIKTIRPYVRMDGRGALPA